MDAARRIVVTGANRGIGLEFVRQYAAAGDTVFAFARRPDGAPDLQALAERHEGRVHRIACDVGDASSVARAAARVADLADGVDLLLNNAGVAGKTGSPFGALDFADLEAAYRTNALGPLRVAEALLAGLRRGRSPRIVLITSLMGSIADNGTGGWWAYRMSKAALNMACRNLMHELRGTGIATMVLHPGWVRTDMGGQGAPLSAEESVRGMRAVIEDLTPAGSGCFRDHAGNDLPW